MFRPQWWFLLYLGVPQAGTGYVQPPAGDTRTNKSGVTAGIARPDPTLTSALGPRKACLRWIQPNVQTPMVVPVVLGCETGWHWVCAVSCW